MRLQFRSPDVRATTMLVAVLSTVSCAATDATGDEALRRAVPESGGDLPAPAPVHAPGSRAVEDPLHTILDVTFVASEEAPWLLSAALTTGAAFTEALPSWNVKGAGPFVVDLRVSPGPAGADWSPWLRIGDWGVATRGREISTAFDGGKVAVDVLELSQPQMRAQMRVARADGSKMPPGDVRASIALSDLRELDTRLASAATEPWPIPVQLKVPVRSQRREDDDIAHRICSPTSVAMVAAYHGASVPTKDMAETILDPHFDIYGNWNRAVQGAFSYGVPGRLVRVSSWDTVQAYLADGRPLVASIRAKEGELEGAPYTATAGHLLVVTGLGPGGIVHVNDPAASWRGSVPRRYMREEMENVWFARGGVAYAFEPRTPDGRLGQ